MIGLRTVYRERLVTQEGRCLAEVEANRADELNHLMGGILTGMTIEDGVAIPAGVELKRVSLNKWGCLPVGKEQKLGVRPLNKLYG